MFISTSSIHQLVFVGEAHHVFHERETESLLYTITFLSIAPWLLKWHGFLKVPRFHLFVLLRGHVDEDDQNHWWHDTWHGTPEYMEENLSQCHLVHHKFFMDWPGIKLGLQWQETKINLHYIYRFTVYLTENIMLLLGRPDGECVRGKLLRTM